MADTSALVERYTVCLVQWTAISIPATSSSALMPVGGCSVPVLQALYPCITYFRGSCSFLFRTCLGMVMAVLAFVSSGLLQVYMDHTSTPVTVAWQVVNGAEGCYSLAPGFCMECRTRDEL